MKYKIVSVIKPDHHNRDKAIQELCIINPNKTTTLLGGDEHEHIKLTHAIQMIKNGEAIFYTENPKHAEVIIKYSEQGNEYLTTEPDGISKNNLLELPKCKHI